MEQYIITLKENDSYYTELLDGSIDDIVKKYKKKKFKLDKIVDVKKISYTTLQQIIGSSKTVGFSYGIVLNNHYILCEELTVNAIIDYDNSAINFDNLNNYLFEHWNDEIRLDVLNMIFPIFQTESYYYDGKSIIPLKFANRFHIKNRTDKESIKECIHKSINTLYSMINPSGKFVYGYNTSTGNSLDSYSIVRHLGALWSLCLLYDEIDDTKAKDKIDKVFDFVCANCLEYNGSKAFIFENKSTNYRLGSNALGLLALCEYYEKFKDDKYMEIAEKLARGILSCQQPNGCFYHGYNHKLELTEKNIIVYFDGEAVFALLKYYAISKNEVYYKAVLDAFDYFIDYNYEKETDHWIAHALRELFRFNHEDKYIRFLNANCVPSATRCFAPARMEAIISLYEAYTYLKDNNYSSEVLDDFPLKKILRGIKFRIENLMCYYIGEEVALYLNNEDKFMYGFHAPHDSFRMRIDDIQHTVSGLYHYYLSNIDIKDIK